MQNLRNIRSPQHRVIAEFEGSALSFPLPREATFEELAARLAALGRSHRGAPISIEVTIGLDQPLLSCPKHSGRRE
jgi:hypothetical protein